MRIRISTFLLVIVAILSLVACSRSYEKEYYKNKNNFIAGEAIVDNIIYNEQEEYIVLWLSETEEVYETSDFIIRGENTKIVLKNGILDKIKIGDRITYSSAPRIFGNGYFMPIIELSIGDAELLSFEDGHRNLMNLY